MPWPRRCVPLLIAGVLACVPACGTKTPLQPVNRSPVVESLVAFPTTLAPGDSAMIVCQATDPEGDELRYFWDSDCRLLLKGALHDVMHGPANAVVVHAGTCAHAPLDTGWVRCSVSDGRGGFVGAGIVRIVIQH